MGHELLASRALDCVKPCYNRYVAVDKFIQYFLLSFGSNLTILFRYLHIFIRMLFDIRNVLPLKSFRNPPPKNTPNHTEKLDFSYNFFFSSKRNGKNFKCVYLAQFCVFYNGDVCKYMGSTRKNRFRKNENHSVDTYLWFIKYHSCSTSLNGSL